MARVIDRVSKLIVGSKCPQDFDFEIKMPAGCPLLVITTADKAAKVCIDCWNQEAIGGGRRNDNLSRL